MQGSPHHQFTTNSCVNYIHSAINLGHIQGSENSQNEQYYVIFPPFSSLSTHHDQDTVHSQNSNPRLGHRIPISDLGNLFSMTYNRILGIHPTLVRDQQAQAVVNVNSKVISKIFKHPVLLEEGQLYINPSSPLTANH